MQGLERERRRLELTMRFPDKLIVMARDAESGLPVANVALILHLFAAQKNDYDVGPAITDDNGSAEFTREYCESAIHRSKEMFLMDYAGNLASCRPMIEVSLHRAEHIAVMLRNYQKTPSFWGQAFKEPGKVFAAMAKVENASYQPAVVLASEEEILAKPELVLRLVRK